MSSENPFFILIAEDDPDDQDILQILLDTHFPQWHYHIVNNGQLLIDYLTNKTPRQFPVSLVLIDINMPVKDGIETLKSLRTMLEYKYLPVVAFSTSGNKWMEDIFMKAGGNAYLQKPDKMEQMVYILSQLPELIQKTGNK
ncbi:response regulator [Xanthocytophaga agilis]|uniref:Response regulator n=1 Tax=Xanthocytophaga agilis TaxID=3048010 RepID=A0AAE3UHU5_9BACT|nr:response regulator [Xanthocytophaga agilis]MDJ1505845.1 response regulator [Xanthocytophaga agilis]